ncbi:NAD(P)H-dependent oxidoreductase [Ilumatobacter sp.]|uniref:NAD(P)H-dependent oxidoreductase n=1 Tax=Ilumatobacter sp. TaxID=1967498 RepID=UPI003AF823DA
MNALVVIAHPCSDSFCHAAARRAVDGLQAAGHDVDIIDLYGERFRAAMSCEERIAYHTDVPILDPQVGDHAARLQRAAIVVFVYPTWWSGLPAILKGWLERVMVPGVGFTFDESSGKVRPGLGHVRRLVGISTYGSPRTAVRLVNDNGRRILTRALRMSCGFRARTTWLALYGMDTSTPADRTAFLARVEQKTATL